MSIEEYSKKNKNIEEFLLTFLEADTSTKENYNDFIDFIDDNKIFEDEHELVLFLHLISKISKYHHRNSHFISKIEFILQYYKTNIQEKLTNFEIFNIFKGSKRILLFLFEEQILKIDKQIIEKFITKKYVLAKYTQYFSPEIKQYMKENWIEEIEQELPKNFNELRKAGENESYICELIRNDSIDDFIVYVNKRNYSLQSTIVPSIYETNKFLINKQIERYINSGIDSKQNVDHQLTLIQYAAFFGAIQILRYLQLNKVEITSELYFFAIYGKNPELIHHLEANLFGSKVEYKSNNSSNQNIDQNQYTKYLEESIKCHHNDIANYLLESFFQINDIKSNNIINQCIKYYNFSLIQNKLIDENSFFSLCQYDYCWLVDYLINNNKINVNRI